ncbi:hypothetical protein PR003_g26028 [Phytophthora rubi]|uniref:Uncharacterized protein n=2 Tax=Phytophthora rubi TaxID=129364 RepID=A0A6A4CIX8_9STRA|nr:hypothetical protein PR001_g29432 [Phytophthora rubi]KAE9287533.1 hypothetical protein PR003_g26028 [Phytophthora rubi]
MVYPFDKLREYRTSLPARTPLSSRLRQVSFLRPSTVPIRARVPQLLRTAADQLDVLPWSFKVFYRTLPDCRPIYGYHRDRRIFTAFGYMMSDVCADSIAFEPAEREPLDKRGKTQSCIYTVRTFVVILGEIIVGFGFNGEEYGGDFAFSPSISQLITGVDSAGDAVLHQGRERRGYELP